MKFAVITPTEGLERYATLSTVQMALVQNLNDQEYADFYQERKSKGDTLILDNGAYEGVPIEPLELFNHIKEVRPHIAILPDFLLRPARETLSASIRFLDKYADDLRMENPGLEFMFVPQAPLGEDMDILSSVATIVNDLRVGPLVTWIGLPRVLHTHFGGRRPWIAAHLKRSFPNLKLHALGSGDGSITEFKALESLGVESMDSSTPVWRGWNGYALDSEDKWPDIPVDFRALFPAENADAHHLVIMENLKAFGVEDGTKS